MRVVSWNCGDGLHRKFSALHALAPDVAIVQECADLDTLVRKAPGFAPADALWSGRNPNRGLGVFSFGRYRLKRAARDDPAITYALPARVAGPCSFNLLALWAHYGKAPVRVGSPGPALLALDRFADFLSERASILAGDLNNHVRWDRPGKASNHATAVAVSAGLGLVSAYHSFFGLEQGAERHPTLYWRDRSRSGPKFHIDYVFVPRRSLGLLHRVRVGSYAKWIGKGLSDHTPVIVDLLDGFAAGRASRINGSTPYRAR
jgi:hypothetical protein